MLTDLISFLILKSKIENGMSSGSFIPTHYLQQFLYLEKLE